MYIVIVIVIYFHTAFSIGGKLLTEYGKLTHKKHKINTINTYMETLRNKRKTPYLLASTPWLEYQTEPEQGGTLSYNISFVLVMRGAFRPV